MTDDYEIFDYLEEKGYTVYKGDALKQIKSSELINELINRGHYYSNMDNEGIIEEAESRGFCVIEKNKEYEILQDIYRHATWMQPEQLRDYLNDLFIKYLNKWL